MNTQNHKNHYIIAAGPVQKIDVLTSGGSPISGLPETAVSSPIEIQCRHCNQWYGLAPHVTGLAISRDAVHVTTGHHEICPLCWRGHNAGARLPMRSRANTSQ